MSLQDLSKMLDSAMQSASSSVSNSTRHEEIRRILSDDESLSDKEVMDLVRQRWSPKGGVKSNTYETKHAKWGRRTFEIIKQINSVLGRLDQDVQDRERAELSRAVDEADKGNRQRLEALDRRLRSFVLETKLADEEEFKRYLSTKPGGPRERAIGNVVSRCKRVQKRTVVGLDKLFVEDGLEGVLSWLVRSPEDFETDVVGAATLKTAVTHYRDFRETRSDEPADALARSDQPPLNTILYGPPGTGKTYLTAQRCVEICDGPDVRDDDRKRYKELVASGRVEFVTFHQSYGYEEFVEGLRPVPNEGGQAGFRLVPTPGVIKRIADRARGDLENAYVLVIDEINRANISKVMGELITLLEEDKREGASNEVAVTLPHSGDEQKFTLPPNLHILGTMNTADRSIALIDTALRRRFQFEEMAPEPELLSVVDGVDLPAVLKTINERLEYLYDRDHLIGHAWLMNASTKADVDDIMRRKIIPLIAEYFYDDWRKVRAVLGGADDFVRGERLAPPPGLDEEDVDERFRWTVRDDFASDAYRRLISGQSTSPEADADA